LYCYVFFILFIFNKKIKITNNIMKKNKNKNACFKKLDHSEAIFLMALMGHHNTPYSKMADILVFFCLLENERVLPRLRENILLNFEFQNETTRANLQVNKRILK